MSSVEQGVNSTVESDRRQRLQHTLDELLEERQQVIVAYCRLSGITSFAQRDAEPNRVQVDRLRSFLQVLVDYTALGHFEVYQRIIEGRERRQEVRAVAGEVYPAIAETTDFLVDFNDKYDHFDGEDDIDALGEDLSRLGQILAVRSELEDRILAALQASVRG
jgi:regulator of sigma D